MECFACHPYVDGDPYPNGPVCVVKAIQLSDLILLRTKEALINRENGEDVYLVGAPFAISWVAEDGTDGEITVPAGFITDLTSVPPLFRLFVSRAGPWLEAAVTHDYLYIAWQLVEGRGPRDQDRKWADDVMFAAMKAAKVSAWRRWAIYLALRVGGRWTYQRSGEGIANFGNVNDPRLEYLAAVPQVQASEVV